LVGKWLENVGKIDLGVTFYAQNFSDKFDGK